jgi:hypothetical protein
VDGFCLDAGDEFVNSRDKSLAQLAFDDPERLCCSDSFLNDGTDETGFLVMDGPTDEGVRGTEGVRGWVLF